jgi:antirestriction protein ArdC
MKTDRFDIHQHITDKIVSAIEHGAGEFRLPWHRSAGSIMRPVNIASKKAYRGVNVLALWATADENGFSAGVWALTGSGPRSALRCARARKPPSWSSTNKLAFAADPEPCDTETATRLFARATPVFAAEQVNG